MFHTENVVSYTVFWRIPQFNIIYIIILKKRLGELRVYSGIARVNPRDGKFSLSYEISFIIWNPCIIYHKKALGKRFHIMNFSTPPISLPQGGIFGNFSKSKYFHHFSYFLTERSDEYYLQCTRISKRNGGYRSHYSSLHGGSTFLTFAIHLMWYIAENFCDPLFLWCTSGVSVPTSLPRGLFLNFTNTFDVT